MRSRTLPLSTQRKNLRKRKRNRSSIWLSWTFSLHILRSTNRLLRKWLCNESRLRVRKPWGHSEVPGPVQRTIRWVSLAINKDLRLVHHDLQLWVTLHGHGGRGRLKRRNDRDVYEILDWIRLRRSSYSAIQINQVVPKSVTHDPKTGKSRLNIRDPPDYRRGRLIGVIDHEIETHFIRKFNERF